MDREEPLVAAPEGAFRLDGPGSVVARSLIGTRLATTRAIFPDNHGITDAIAPADGYVLIQRLAENPDHDLWTGGKPIDTHAGSDQRVRMISMQDGELYACMRRGGNGLLHFIPTSSLVEASEALGGRQISELDVQLNAAVKDDVLHHLGLALLPSLEAPDTVNQLLIDQVGLMVSMHLVQRYGTAQAGRTFRRGGLAPWQERRAKELLMQNINGDISLDELAAQCDLSAGYFARAFRATTGQTAHKWLTDRRIALAKHKLERSTASLAEIARDCGFADQSHFTRMFSREVGYAPGAWRRARLG